MKLFAPRCYTSPIATEARRPANVRSPIHRWRANLIAAGLAGLALLAAAAPARATIVYGQSSVCEGYDGSDCYAGPSANWQTPNGPLVSTSVAHSWSDAASIGDTFSLVGSAQSSVQGVNHWTADVSAGGYINFSYYNHNQLDAVASALIEDEYLLPSTSMWSGLGFLALTYHLTGDASSSYQYIGTDPSTGRNVSAASLSILCYNTGHGNCTATGLQQSSPGTFTASLVGPYDNTVTFLVPVQSDVAGFYQFRDTLSAGLQLYGNADGGHIIGGATADFTHTVQLVGADLLDASMSPVSDWSIISGSGFDYAHIAAIVPQPPAGTVPEPSTFALIGAGLLGTTLTQRRRVRVGASRGAWC